MKKFKYTKQVCKDVWDILTECEFTIKNLKGIVLTLHIDFNKEVLDKDYLDLTNELEDKLNEVIENLGYTTIFSTSQSINKEVIK